MHKDSLPVAPSGDIDRRDAVPRDEAFRQPFPSTVPASLPGTASENMAENQDEVDLLAYWRVIVKRRWLIVAILASVLLLTLLWTLTTAPIYRATSVLQIDNEEQNLVQPAGLNAAGQASNWDPQFLQTQYELLKSRALAERVADYLNLDPDAAAAMNRPSWLQRVRSMLRPANKEAPKSGQNAAADRRAMAEVVREGLKVEPVATRAW